MFHKNITKNKKIIFLIFNLWEEVVINPVKIELKKFFFVFLIKLKHVNYYVCFELLKIQYNFIIFKNKLWLFQWKQINF